jgi:hypothetical protein
MLTDLTPSTHSLRRRFIRSKPICWLDPAVYLGVPFEGRRVPPESGGVIATLEGSLPGHAVSASDGGTNPGRLDNSRLLRGFAPALRTHIRAGPLG